MSGWYIRRGDSVVGPADSAKLQELVATGQLRPTDELASDVAGPWQLAGNTALFASPASSTELAPSPAKPIAKVESSPPTVVDPPKPNVAIRAASLFGRGVTGSLVSVKSYLVTRSQRKHEIKLAKIQVEAIRAAQQPPPTIIREPRRPAPSPPPAPAGQQTTVVKVVNANFNRPRYFGCSGCTGCLVFLLLVVIAAIAAHIYFEVDWQDWIKQFRSMMPERAGTIQ